MQVHRNRIYQKQQVDFALCSCLKQTFLPRNRQQIPQLQNQRENSYAKNAGIKNSPKPKIVGLKLSKKIAVQVSLGESGIREKHYNLRTTLNNTLQQSECQLRSNISSMRNILSNQSKNMRIYVISPEIGEKMRETSASYFRNKNQGNCYNIQQNTNQNINNQWIRSSNYFQFCQGTSSKNMNKMQQYQRMAQKNEENMYKDATPAYKQIQYIITQTWECNKNQNGSPNHAQYKYNSTSSTTLFETKKCIDECITKQLHRDKKVPKQEDQNDLQLVEKPANHSIIRNDRSKNPERKNNQRRNQTEKMGLYIVDFSRVREVQTVMSDSFSASFLDVDCQLSSDPGNKVPIELGREIENQVCKQIKRLLAN